MTLVRAVAARSVAGVAPDTPLRAARDARAFLRGAAGGAYPPGSAALLASTLEVLHGVLPYDCAALSLWDPARGRHDTRAGVGYPATTLRFLNSRMHTDPLFVEVRDGRAPVRVRDIPRSRRRGEVFETVIEPLGFADGMTQCLFARDGRYVGMLNASTLDPRHPGDDAVALLELLADDLAAVLDPLPPLAGVTRALAEGAADGILVTRAGPPVALSAGARPDLAEAPSPLAPLLAGVLAGAEPPRALLVAAGAGILAVTLDGGPQGVVVLHRPVPAPFGLTPRELQVLDAVSRGRTNAQTARALGVAPRTVATHVEHVLAKTGCANRAEAARLSARLGLLV
jgi:DNA-binding CsgD family transcriptional regulator